MGKEEFIYGPHGKVYLILQGKQQKRERGKDRAREV